jgi:hypothetical protein
VGSIVAWLLVVGCVATEAHYSGVGTRLPKCRPDQAEIAEACYRVSVGKAGVFADHPLPTMLWLLAACLILGIVAAAVTIACVRKLGVTDPSKIRDAKIISWAAVFLANLIALGTVFSTSFAMAWPSY